MSEVNDLIHALQTADNADPNQVYSLVVRLQGADGALYWSSQGVSSTDALAAVERAERGYAAEPSAAAAADLQAKRREYASAIERETVAVPANSGRLDAIKTEAYAYLDFCAVP